ncbi:MAG: ATP-binding protein [Clostridia bacterium]|nr:ATP-binding protein [Clostridia bacterium]
MVINRDKYLNKLIERKHNGLIKLVTGIRRCGKSYLLNTIFVKHLLECGIKNDHIICVNFDDLDNIDLREIRNANKYLKSKIIDDDMYYFILDEVQLMYNKDDSENSTAFFEVLNSLMHLNNTDIYATGSNSRFLSSDIISTFRGRSDEIRVHPLTFKEYYNALLNINSNTTKEDALEKYTLYGGLPLSLTYTSYDAISDYLKNTFKEIYKLDIKERYKINNNIEFDEIVNFISSQIGSQISYLSLSKTFKSVKNKSISDKTIKRYIDFLIGSYILNQAKRYDVKGKKYINSSYKLYFEDLGLRNARINFSQNEKTHLMENLIYNELIERGYNVDTGDISIVEKRKDDDTFIRKKLEIDFVATKFNRKYYIQSAYSINDPDKLMQEQRSLLAIKDSNEKIIITYNMTIPRITDEGIKIISIYDFLLGDIF